MLRRSLILAFVAVTGVSCAQRLGDIDTTHDNVVLKSTLGCDATGCQGQWYYREMVTDVQTLAAYTEDIQRNFIIIGSTTPLHRIRWEIFENELVAFAIDEFLPGANDAGDEKDLEETVVARFPILSHFDIRRQYDMQTGEESNVLYEDTSSRKWYERDYMRVDWSTNQAISIDDNFPSETGLLHQIDGMGDNDALQVEVTDEHIMTVNEHPVKVSVTYYDQYGNEQVYDFATSKVTVFTSILRIDEDSDYQPLDYPAQVKKKDQDGNVVLDEDGEPVQIDVFNRYGFFQTMRQHHDRYEGQLDSNRYYYINRFNIWERWTNAQGEEIPIQDRKLRPIVYFVAEDYPEEMLPAAKRIGEIWNKGFLKALADVGYPVTSDTVAFAVCENPVTASSPAVCQSKGLGLKLFGDLRYNFLKLALPTGTINPLGYGPGSHDPFTGETINAWAVTYYSGLNNYAKRALDMVKLYNGEVDAQSLEWLEGDYFQGLQETLKRTFGTEDLQAGASSQMLAELRANTRIAARELRRPEMRNFIRRAQSNMREALGGRSLIEAMAGADFNHTPSFAALGDDAFEGFLPANANPERLPDLLEEVRTNPSRRLLQELVEHDHRTRFFSEHCIYVQEFADPTVGYIAARMAKKYPYPEVGAPDRDERIVEIDGRILDELRDAIYIGVQLHEVGHNLGLRHNFAASTDEINFIQPGVSSLEVAGDVYAGPTIDIRKGYWTVATDPDGDPMERLEYQYSSIMDYGANFASDIHGIGAYDVGAIRFGYLGHIELFEDGHPTTEMYAHLRDEPHEMAQAMRAKLDNRIFVPFDPAKIEVARSIFEEYVVDPQGPALEVVQRQPNGTYIRVPLEDEDGNPVHGYFINKHGFCTDTFADFFDPFCTRWDVGRDPFEIQELYGERLRENYWFLNYRRGRSDAPYSFNGSIINTVTNRYFMYAIRAGILASYINAIYGIDTVEWLESNDGLRVYHQIGALALNDVINTLMTPDTGFYGWDTDGTAPVFEPLFGSAASTGIEISNGPYVHPVWSEYGYNKDEYITVNRYGFFNNKLGAMLSMLAGFFVNLSQFQEGDMPPGLGSLSLANAFKGETAEMLKIFLTGETNRYAHVPLVGNTVATPGQDPDGVAPGDRVLKDMLYMIANSQGGTVPPDVDINDTLPRVDQGATSYEFEYAYMWTAGYLNSPWDRTWERYLRIRRAGDSLGSDVYADPGRVVEWADEGTGYVWQAYRYDPVRAVSGLDVDPSVGAYFLEWVADRVQEYDDQIANGEPNAERRKQAFLEHVRYKLDFMYSVQEIYSYR